MLEKLLAMLQRIPASVCGGMVSNEAEIRLAISDGTCFMAPTVQLANVREVCAQRKGEFLTGSMTRK